MINLFQTIDPVSNFFQNNNLRENSSKYRSGRHLKKLKLKNRPHKKLFFKNVDLYVKKNSNLCII